MSDWSTFGDVSILQLKWETVKHENNYLRVTPRNSRARLDDRFWGSTSGLSTVFRVSMHLVREETVKDESNYIRTKPWKRKSRHGDSYSGCISVDLHLKTGRNQRRSWKVKGVIRHKRGSKSRDRKTSSHSTSEDDLLGSARHNEVTSCGFIVPGADLEPCGTGDSHSNTSRRRGGSQNRARRRRLT